MRIVLKWGYLFRLLTNSIAARRLGQFGEHAFWFMLVISFLAGRVYSQSAIAGPRSQPLIVNCKACDLGPLQNRDDSADGWPSPSDAKLSGTANETFRAPGIVLSAQNQQNPPEVQNEGRDKKQSSPSAISSSPGHIFWVIPAFKVDYGRGFKPLTVKEKFDEWARATYDPLGLGAGAVEAATLEHSSKDGFCGYGGGFGGYGKCFAALEADATISSFIGDFGLTALLHQDPRYFQLGKGSFGKRVSYAVSRVFVTYNDSGRTVLSTSTLVGTTAAAGISNLYYPKQDRTFGHTVSRIGLDLANTALYNAAAEFWPDINRKLHHMF